MSAVEYCPEQIEARRILAHAVYSSGDLTLIERMTIAVLPNYAGADAELIGKPREGIAILVDDICLSAS